MPALLALVVALLLPSVAPAAERLPVHVYRVAQNLTLDEGQSGSFTLACRAGDIATDGTWRVDSVDTNPQIDDEQFDLVNGVDVLEAAAFSRQAYRFSLRNNAEGDAAVRIAVTCLRATMGRHRLVVRTPPAVTTTLAASAATTLPAVACPSGTVAIASGLRVDGDGAARLISRMPALPGLGQSTVTMLGVDAVTVVASARCLEPRTTRRDRRRFALRMAFRSADAQVDAAHVASFTVSCRTREVAIGSGFSLSAAWYLGQTPSARQRSFRVQARPDAAGTARLGLLCLRDRAAAVRR